MKSSPVSILIGALGLLSIVAPLVWVIWLRPAYEASAVLRIARQPGIIDDAKDDPLEYAAYKHLQLELILSPMVLTRALGRSEVRALPTITNLADPVDSVRRHIVLEEVGDSTLLRVVLYGS